MEYNKKFYGKTRIDSSDSEESISEIDLEYYGTENTDLFLNDIKPYGIEVIKKIFRNGQLLIEAKVLNNLYMEECEINKILNLLMTNKVTPVGVEDVLADIV